MFYRHNFADKKPVDIIELGAPFTDPIADGPTIQTSNNVIILYSSDLFHYKDVTNVTVLADGTEERRQYSVNTSDG